MVTYDCKVLVCDCENEWQDSHYGKGKRLHNPMVANHKLIGYRCTVCGKEKRVIR